MSIPESKYKNQKCACFIELERLEAERDRLKIQDGVHHAQLEEARTEIDRLKAELDQQMWAAKINFDEHSQYQSALRKDRDLWKSKAEKAIELTQEMIAYHFCDDNKPDYFNKKYDWSKRLAELEKGVYYGE